MATPMLNILQGFKSLKDFQAAAEEHALNSDLKRAQIAKYMTPDQGRTANAPAALQIADAYQQARQAGDTQRMKDIASFAKAYDKGIFENSSGAFVADQGYSGGAANLAAAKAGAKQQAERSVDLNMLPRIEVAKDQAAESSSAEKTLPVIGTIEELNKQTFDSPFASKYLGGARTIPSKSVQDKVIATDRLLSSRQAVAAPLAKMLGVNPTDTDLKATLDGIFNIDASKASRQAQINDLKKRLLDRQRALSSGSALPAQPYGGAPSSGWSYGGALD